jgi:hypothetical protein
MAVIYSYPKATPSASDLLIGTLTTDPSGENPTKTFAISDIIGLIPAAGTGGTVTSVGVTAGSFITVTNSPITTSGNITVGLTENGGTPSTTTFYRGDGQWAAPVGTGTQITYALTSATNASNTDITLTPSTGTPDIVKLIPSAPITISNNDATNEITIGSDAVTGVTAAAAIGTAYAISFIEIGGTTQAPTVALTATGTPSSTTYLRGDGSWATIAAGGTMSSWDLQADTGTDETIVDAEQVKMVGGSGIDTSIADNAGVAEVTVALEATVPQTIAAGVTTQVYDAANTTKNIAITGTQNTEIAVLNILSNSTDSYASAKVNNVISLTQTEYNAIGAPDANTLYVIV